MRSVKTSSDTSCPSLSLSLSLSLFLSLSPPLCVTPQLDGHPSVGAELRVIAEFNNPLPTKLTRGRFLLEGGGLTEPVKIKVNRYGLRMTVATQWVVVDML